MRLIREFLEPLNYLLHFFEKNVGCHRAQKNNKKSILLTHTRKSRDKRPAGYEVNHMKKEKDFFVDKTECIVVRRLLHE